MSPLRSGTLEISAEERRYTRLLQNIYDRIYDLDFLADTCRAIHQSGEDFHVPPCDGGIAAMLTHAAGHLIHPDDRDKVQRLFLRDELRRSLGGSGKGTGTEYRRRCRHNGYCRARIAIFPFGESGEERYLACVQDIDSAIAPEIQPHESVQTHLQNLDYLRYKAIIEQTRSLTFEWQGRACCAVDPTLPQVLAGNYDSRHLFDLWREDHVLFPEDRAVFEGLLRALKEKAPACTVTVRLRRRTGTFAWYLLACTRIGVSNGSAHYMGSLRNVDETIQAAHALRLQAEFDDLTGACTMPAFLDKVERLRHAGPDVQRHMVRYDVAGFKFINERFGQTEGRRLLRAISYLTRENLLAHREPFARFSGDIFLACLEGGPRRVRAFLDALRCGMADYSRSYRPELFFGICPMSPPTVPLHDICEQTYLAVNSVKGRGMTDHAFYDETLRERMEEEQFVRDQMYTALSDGQFVIFLQPKVEIRSGRIVGAEALVRWNHPERGLISPNRFVPIFERCGFILRLDEYVWEETCKLLRFWLDKDYRTLPVSINVSRLHFNDNGFSDKLRALADKYRLPRNLLELELTESAFFENEKILQQTMRSLQKSGFAFSMDDFGAGYSSLKTLRALPFDAVKLDRSFVSGHGPDVIRSRIVARNTITLARQLGMRIIAEGVETVEQALFLQSMGCDYAQGFYYARAMNPREFEIFSFVRETPFTPGRTDLATVLQNRPGISAFAKQRHQ